MSEWAVDSKVRTSHGVRLKEITSPDEALAVVVARDRVGFASADTSWTIATGDPAAAVAAVEATRKPRWVWWSARETAMSLVRSGARPAACWDLAAVHRLLTGRSRDDPA